MYSDLPADQLRAYTSSQTRPADFAEFWSETLDEARSHPLNLTVTAEPTVLETIDVYDVEFAGWNGEPVRAWLRLPHGAAEALPCVVEFVGYGGGRGEPHENLLWAGAGFAHLHMDTRGQGASWSKGATPDGAGSGGPQVPGVMTRGILDPQTYYYRRLFTDAVRAVQAARELAVVNPDRVAVTGISQGGAVALAATALCPGLRGAVVRVPFLSDFPRALQITDAYPYREVRDFLSVHRTEADRAQETLRYFDGVNFAAQATVPALFTAGLMDAVTPPSTVYAAYNAYAGPKQITAWPFNGHEGGGAEDDVAAVHFLREMTAAGASSEAATAGAVAVG
ncbi:cephalosporin-C deacetylase [Arthrobacter sp. UYP6]|uniref:acetylxylan esterase n=1 Tax=Arthrobacter sp. UYP6 TaxID=1756378 RepID=UPI0033947B37